MKIALLSDIHGNHNALKVCLDYIDENKYEGVAFLGDYITDCPYPKKTIALVKDTMSKYKTWCIKGNREEYLLDYRDGKSDWKYNSQTGSLLYSYENITEKDLSFFEEMPITKKVNIAGCKPFVICHGSPAKSRENLLPNIEITKAWLDKIDCDYMFCGHTHAPFIYEYNGKTLTNCGSIGIPVNNQTMAQFASIEYINEAWCIDIVSVPYNISNVLDDYITSGAYEKYKYWAMLCAKCVQTGVNYPLHGIIRAEEIAKQNEESLNESHWKQALIELKLEE